MNTLLLLSISFASAQDLSEPSSTAVPPPAYASVTEELEGARIDWTELRLEITGASNRTVGAWQSWPGQEQEVVEILQTRFPIAARQVMLRPGLVARSIMAAESELGLRTERGAMDWHIEETRYKTSGGVEIDAYLDLRIWLEPALRQPARRHDLPLPISGPTGVLIDARGVDFRPALVPTITMSSGLNLTQAERVGRNTIEESTAVLYVSDPSDPRAIDRAGKNPLFAIARVGGPGTLELASTAWENDPALDALVAHGRVVVIAGPELEIVE
jgi:hypothetical protein